MYAKGLQEVHRRLLRQHYAWLSKIFDTKQIYLIPYSMKFFEYLHIPKSYEFIYTHILRNIQKTIHCNMNFNF